MKVIKWLDQYLEEILIMLILLAFVIIMAIQIFMRYVMNSSLPWPEEVLRYCFIWFTFLGMSYGIKYSYHIRIDILETFFPQLKKPFAIIGNLTFLVICVLMFNPSIQVLRKMALSNQTSPALAIHMEYIYVSLFIGFSLSIIRLIQKLYSILFAKEKDAVKVGGEL